MGKIAVAIVLGKRYYWALYYIKPSRIIRKDHSIVELRLAN